MYVSVCCVLLESLVFKHSLQQVEEILKLNEPAATNAPGPKWAAMIDDGRQTETYKTST